MALWDDSSSSDKFEKFRSEIMSELKKIETRNEFFLISTYMKDGESFLDAKKRFFRNLPKAGSNRRKLQIALTDLVGKLTKILDDNNIKYWITAGTALGALRHEGFIPWDDDIDLQICRDDIPKLRLVLEDNDFFNLRTTYDLKNGCRHEVVTCKKYLLLIDIFPIDIYRSDLDAEGEKRKHIEQRNLLTKDFSKYPGLLSKYPGWKFIDDKEDLKVINTIFDKYAHKDNGTKYSYWSIGIDSIYVAGHVARNPKMFDNIIYVKFEWIKLKAPSCLEEYVTMHFGDYLRFPDLIPYDHFPFSNTIVESIDKYLINECEFEPNITEEKLLSYHGRENV